MTPNVAKITLIDAAVNASLNSPEKSSRVVGTVTNLLLNCGIFSLVPEKQMNSNKLDLSSLNVMVVDDNRYFVIILSEILRAFGVRNVARHHSLAPAFEDITRRHYDIVFIDLEMGSENGYVFIDRVRTAPELNNRSVKFVVVSAYAELGHVRKAIEVGADEFLRKPISPTSVYTRLMKVIEQPLQYIRTKNGYYGPERRRAFDPTYTGFERRVNDETELV